MKHRIPKKVVLLTLMAFVAMNSHAVLKPAPAAVSAASMPSTSPACGEREYGASSSMVGRATASDLRLIVFPYDNNALFPVNTAFNKFTHFEFEQGEKIIGSYLNDDTEFEMKVSSTGRDIFVRPKVRGAVGAMTVVTDRRRYEIELLDIAGCAGKPRYQRVSWLYNEATYEDRTALAAQGGGMPPRRGNAGSATNDPLPGMVEPPRPPDPRDLLRVDLKNVNDAYVIDGEPELAPVSVLDDGNRTLIKFAADMKLRPVLFALSPDGQAEAVSYVPVDAYFVVPNRVFTHGAMLRLGAREVTILPKPKNCSWWQSCRPTSAKPSNMVGDK